MKIFKLEDLDVYVEKKKIKNIYLRVKHKENKVTLSVPLRITDSYIQTFLESKKEWIKETLASKEQYHETRELTYETGEKHFLWGREYTLDVVENSYRTDIYLDGNSIVMQIKKDVNIDRETLLNTFYKKELSLVLPKIIEHCENVVQVKCNEVLIKNMKTRWGTCNIPKKRIWLNLQLAKKPPKCLTYVVIHELVHLYEPSHNARFKAFMNKFCPDWVDIKDDLNSQNYD